MKSFLKKMFLGTSMSYFILGIFNLIRFVVFHYYYNIPLIINFINNKSINEYDNLSEIGSSFYYFGYMENSIEIQIYILLISILIGIAYGIIKYRKSN